jgi:hypothetical protein
MKQQQLELLMVVQVGLSQEELPERVQQPLAKLHRFL